MDSEQENQQSDLFVRLVSDIGGNRKNKSLQDFMARNWFALGKRHKLKSLEHKFGDGFVKITTASEKHGIATIYDYDFLLFAITQLRQRIDKGDSVSDGTLSFQVADFLLFKNAELRKRNGKRRARTISGREYKDFWQSLERLHSTHVQTNIKANGYTYERQFVWLSDIYKKELNNKISEVKVGVASWLLNRVQEEKQLLTFNEEYFTLNGGLERWLFLYCRKCCGKSTWKENLKSIHEKSGAQERFTQFKSRMKRLIKKHNGQLLNYQLMISDDEMLEIRFNNKKMIVQTMADGTRTIEG
jgi:plasmid replication initiation protein